MSRLKEKYLKEILPNLQKELGLTNSMQVPRIKKITLNMGVGEILQDKKAIEKAQSDLEKLSGQKPLITKAKKSVASFKIREGMPIGVKVTLRKNRMYEFLDRLINIALPRVRDFRGLSMKSFDGTGNYSLGIKEQIIFPEIDYDNVDKIRGLDITITTSATNNEETLALLNAFNFPIKQVFQIPEAAAPEAEAKKKQQILQKQQHQKQKKQQILQKQQHQKQKKQQILQKQQHQKQKKQQILQKQQHQKQKKQQILQKQQHQKQKKQQILQKQQHQKQIIRKRNKMTRKALVEREIKRAKTVKRFASKREGLKKILQDPNASYEEKSEARINFQKLPRNASPSRLRNRCSITGRPKGFYRKFGLGRNKLREQAMEGNIPGLHKASW